MLAVHVHADAKRTIAVVRLNLAEEIVKTVVLVAEIVVGSKEVHRRKVVAIKILHVRLKVVLQIVVRYQMQEIANGVRRVEALLHVKQKYVLMMAVKVE